VSRRGSSTATPMGRQVMETVGASARASRRKQAESEFGNVLSATSESRTARRRRSHSQQGSERWREEVGALKQWRPATLAQYVSILDRLKCPRVASHPAQGPSCHLRLPRS
jgi:hypothetical protein